jgi:uncharacterized damage-inducible protein DinB
MGRTDDWIALLTHIQERVRAAVADLDAEALNWRPTPEGTNSIYSLTYHMAGSIVYWTLQVIGGQDVGRDRDAEFRAQGTDAAQLLEFFNNGYAKAKEFVAGLTFQDMDRKVATRTFGQRTVRWVLGNIISHQSEHLGHIELTRQLYQAQRGR